jgi:hypothetical protein
MVGGWRALLARSVRTPRRPGLELRHDAAFLKSARARYRGARCSLATVDQIESANTASSRKPQAASIT